MNSAERRIDLSALRIALTEMDSRLTAAQMLERLVAAGLDRLPWPGGGATLNRWQALSLVASHDLSLAKLYEGHTDALAILDELGHALAAAKSQGQSARIWGVWAAESPQGKALIDTDSAAGQTLLSGGKCWCSGASTATHGLMTAWTQTNAQPQLVAVEIGQPGIVVNSAAWQAVGMAGSASVDVAFDGARAEPVGEPGQYLTRTGFWQGGAGVAACWFGGALALASALHRTLRLGGAQAKGEFRRAACGKVDLELRSTAALLREAAAWIDGHAKADARAVALRARLAAERCARTVLDEVGRTLGAGPFCRDARFARMAADLPVFIRQSHAERDFAALGDAVSSEALEAWSL